MSAPVCQKGRHTPTPAPRDGLPATSGGTNVPGRVGRKKTQPAGPQRAAGRHHGGDRIRNRHIGMAGMDGGGHGLLSDYRGARGAGVGDGVEGHARRQQAGRARQVGGHPRQRCRRDLGMAGNAGMVAGDIGVDENAAEFVLQRLVGLQYDQPEGRQRAVALVGGEGKPHGSLLEDRQFRRRALCV